MDFAFWYTLVVLVLMSIALMREIAGADVVVFGALVLLTIPEVITIQEAFHGFANTGMLTVALLFIVGAALKSTGVVFNFAPLVFGRGKLPMPLQLLRFTTPLAALSAFTNNTTIVSSLIPMVQRWARDNNRALSRFLIPLSYATILGGTCTLIGTSTNLVVHGFLLEGGWEGFEFFELAKVGIPVAVAGLLYIAFIAWRMLPDRRDPIDELGEHIREFVFEMKVDTNYAGIGKSIEEAGLRNLRGLFLFQIERGDKVMTAVHPTEKILFGDRLFFTGLPEVILRLQKTPGLITVRDSEFDLKDYDADVFRPFEVVISASSPLIGKSVRESSFRARYDSVILAIHRNGERINKKAGDIVLRAGDTLLILARKEFARKWYNSRDFYLVTTSGAIPSKPRAKGYLALAVLTGFVLTATLNLLPIVLAAAIAAIALVLTGCISTEDGKQSVDWSVLVVIACAFGIGKAVSNAGIATFMAEVIISGLGSFGTIGVLFGVFFATSFYTEVITNNAAAALVFPISVPIAESLGLASPLPLAVLIAIAASASFATPIGYQTNLMVYGPGGYRFRDYLTAGVPLNILVGTVAVVLVYIWYF